MTAVTTNVELARELGADAVIDYRETDFTAGDDRYDLVFDAVGMSSFRRVRRILTPEGAYLTTVPGVVLLEQLVTKRSRIALTGLRKDAAKR
ncbi:NAD(P)-dependent alcohol dehydrogenase, partial [Mesorhizobium sp. M1C.F.Ca.ET.192.01.1.1]